MDDGLRHAGFAHGGCAEAAMSDDAPSPTSNFSPQHRRQRSRSPSPSKSAEIPGIEVSLRARLCTCGALARAVESTSEVLSEAACELKRSVAGIFVNGVSFDAHLRSEEPAVAFASQTLMSACTVLGESLLELADSLSRDVLAPLQVIQRDLQEEHERTKAELDMCEQLEASCINAVEGCAQRKERASARLQEALSGREAPDRGKFLKWLQRPLASSPESKIQHAAQRQTVAVEELALMTDELATVRQKKDKKIAASHTLLQCIDGQCVKLLTRSLEFSARAWRELVRSSQQSVENLETHGVNLSLPSPQRARACIPRLRLDTLPKDEELGGEEGSAFTFMQTALSSNSSFASTRSSDLSSPTSEPQAESSRLEQSSCSPGPAIIAHEMCDNQQKQLFASPDHEMAAIAESPRQRDSTCNDDVSHTLSSDSPPRSDYDSNHVGASLVADTQRGQGSVATFANVEEHVEDGMPDSGDVSSFSSSEDSVKVPVVESASHELSTDSQINEADLSTREFAGVPFEESASCEDLEASQLPGFDIIAVSSSGSVSAAAPTNCDTSKHDQIEGSNTITADTVYVPAVESVCHRSLSDSQVVGFDVTTINLTSMPIVESATHEIPNHSQRDVVTGAGPASVPFLESASLEASEDSQIESSDAVPGMEDFDEQVVCSRHV